MHKPLKLALSGLTNINWTPLVELIVFLGPVLLQPISWIGRLNLVPVVFVLLYPPPPQYGKGVGEVYLNHFVCPSVHLSFCPCVQVCLDNISWTAQLYLTKFGMVVYYEVKCHAQKLVHYLQFQGNSEGFYNQNMIIFKGWSVCNQSWFHSATS